VISEKMRRNVSSATDDLSFAFITVVLMDWQSDSSDRAPAQRVQTPVPQKKKKKLIYICWVLVAHACNPSYSGGGDQEDRSLKPAWVNSSTRPYLKKEKKKNHRKGPVEWLQV
jgi:hypothetical protein